MCHTKTGVLIFDNVFVVLNLISKMATKLLWTAKKTARETIYIRRDVYTNSIRRPITADNPILAVIDYT